MFPVQMREQSHDQTQYLTPPRVSRPFRRDRGFDQTGLRQTGPRLRRGDTGLAEHRRPPSGRPMSTGQNCLSPWPAGCGDTLSSHHERRGILGASAPKSADYRPDQRPFRLPGGGFHEIRTGVSAANKGREAPRGPTTRREGGSEIAETTIRGRRRILEAVARPSRAGRHIQIAAARLIPMDGLDSNTAKRLCGTCQVHDGWIRKVADFGV